MNDDELRDEGYIVAHSAVDVISMIPHMLGVQPEDELILLPLNNTDKDVPSCLRVPLPSGMGGVNQVMDALHSTFHNVIKDKPCTAFYYTDKTQLVGYIQARMMLDALPVKSAVMVHHGRYWELPDDAPDSPGTPYISNNIVPGDPPPFREQLVEQLTSPPSTQTLIAMSDWIDEFTADVTEANYEDYVCREARWMLERLRRTESLVTDEELFRLACATASRRLMNLAWAMLDKGNQCRAFWTDVASRCSMMPDLVFLGAFSNWCAGNGTYAVIFLERALEIAPNHGPSLMLNEGMTHGISGAIWAPPPLEDLPIVRQLAHG